MRKQLLGLICLLVLLSFLLPAAFAFPPAVATETEKSAAPASSATSLEQLRQFAEVFARIRQSYVEDISDEEILRHAIRGMLSGLDPHSSYVREDEYSQLQESTTGEFGGLGMEIGMEDGFVKVIAPMDDTPAARAGIQAGDLITRVNEQTVKGLTLDEAISLMRGEVGTPVTLTIMRAGADAPLSIEIERAIIHVISVRSRLYDDSIGYIRISNFQNQTAADMARTLQKLADERGAPLQGLILDLRNNPGGILGSAVAVTDLLLDSGEIVYTEGRVADAHSRYAAEAGDLLAGAPVVVLVNEGSASGSEIVAGALQDHGRAIIMGRTTFGKGSVQTVIPIDQQSAIKITTARYFTPKGRSIQAEGIVPDIIIDPVTIERVQIAGHVVREATLSRHLANGEAEDAETPTEEANATEDDASATETAAAPSLLEEDFMLYQALNLLKGFAMLQPATDKH